MKENKFIDLHVHSTESDGTLTPTQVVELAKSKGLYAMALTDHDTVAGIKEAIEAAGKEIMVIPGIEISADFNGTDLHILGLGIDYNNEEFLDKVGNCKEIRRIRNEEMIKKMNACGFPLTKELLYERYGTDAAITRAHFARYLLDEGYVATKEEAFKKYLQKGACCYVARKQMKPKDAIDIIKKARGHPVLAHPLLYKFSNEQLYSLVDYLRGLGLEGIEAIYSLNSQSDDVFLKKLADNYGLYITGGSDFHGSNKPDIDLGVGRGNLKIPKELLYPIINN